MWNDAHRRHRMKRNKKLKQNSECTYRLICLNVRIRYQQMITHERTAIEMNVQIKSSHAKAQPVDEYNFTIKTT